MLNSVYNKNPSKKSRRFTFHSSVLAVQTVVLNAFRMGAGGSTPESFFAFQAVQLEYSLLSASEDISKSDLQIHLEALFRTAQAEFFLESPLQCTEPSCILIKMKSFESEDEARRFCKAELSECLAAREKSRPKVQEAQDYSKGFSGTAADTKAEKDFEKM